MLSKQYKIVFLNDNATKKTVQWKKPDVFCLIIDILCSKSKFDDHEKDNDKPHTWLLIDRMKSKFKVSIYVSIDAVFWWVMQFIYGFAILTCMQF